MMMIYMVYLQLTAGLDGAIGRQISQELWESAVPKVNALAPASMSLADGM